MNGPTFTIIGLIILALNLAVFGFNLKLYTEILKDQSQNRRATSKENK